MSGLCVYTESLPNDILGLHILFQNNFETRVRGTHTFALFTPYCVGPSGLSSCVHVCVLYQLCTLSTLIIDPTLAGGGAWGTSCGLTIRVLINRILWNSVQSMTHQE